MFKKVLIIFGTTLILLGCFYYWQSSITNAPSENSQANGKKLISINNKGVSVDIADDAHEQSQGLSGKEYMKENEGMLFIFPIPLMPGFWMKDMNFPIDIIWIGSDGKIIGIEKNFAPETYPQTVQPPSPVKYVLEVNAGWSDRNNIKVGNVLSL